MNPETAVKTNDRQESVGSSSYPCRSAPTYDAEPISEEGGPRPHNAGLHYASADYTSLPQVRHFLGLGWQRHIPPQVGVAFISIAILNSAGCKGREMWDFLETWHRQAKGYKPTPREACAKEDVERRFNAEYGKPWRGTLKGSLALLVELGLVVRDKDESGEEQLRIPDALPLPEDRLNLSKAEKAMLEAIRERNYAGRWGRTIEEAVRVLGQ